MSTTVDIAQATGTWPFVAAAWAVVFGGMGAYALAPVMRGRRVSKQVPPEKRRWS
jgi:hypothetical protein